MYYTGFVTLWTLKEVCYHLCLRFIGCKRQKSIQATTTHHTVLMAQCTCILSYKILQAKNSNISLQLNIPVNLWSKIINVQLMIRKKISTTIYIQQIKLLYLHYNHSYTDIHKKNIHQTNTTSKFHINTVLLKTHLSLIVNIVFVHTLPFVTAGLLPLSVHGFMAMHGICFLNYTAYYR